MHCRRSCRPTTGRVGPPCLLPVHGRPRPDPRRDRRQRVVPLDRRCTRTASSCARRSARACCCRPRGRTRQRRSSTCLTSSHNVSSARGRPSPARCRVPAPAARPARSGSGTSAPRPAARLRVDAEVTGDVDDREQQVAELVTDGLGRLTPAAASRSSAASSAILASAPSTSGQSKPDLGGLALHLVGVRERRQRPGDAVEHALGLPSNVGPPLLGALDRRPSCAAPSSVPSTTTASPNTCGWRRTSLSCTPRATSAIVNRPCCSAIVAWNSIWYSRSPSSSISCSSVRGSSASRPLDRVDHLVGLLDQVGDERPVGLLDVPRALLAQRAGELMEAHVPGGDRRGERRDVQAREVVGLDRTIDLGPRGPRDRLVRVPRRWRITTSSSPPSRPRRRA